MSLADILHRKMTEDLLKNLGTLTLETVFLRIEGLGLEFSSLFELEGAASSLNFYRWTFSVISVVLIIKLIFNKWTGLIR